MPVQLIASPVTLPLADCSARAGSPANDFAGKRLDITDLLVTHPKATFLLRVAGPSMQEHGIDDGDIVVVDRELRARDGSIVVAVVERELVIRVQLGQQVGIGAARHGLPVAQRQVGGLPLRAVGGLVLRLLAVSVPAGLASWFVVTWIDRALGFGWTTALIALAAGATVFGVVLLVATRLVRIAEIDALLARGVGLIRRRS